MQTTRPEVIDRAFALIACFTAGTACFAGKTLAGGVVLLAAMAVFQNVAHRSGLPAPQRDRDAHQALAAFMAFAAFGLASALWAIAPREAVSGAGTFAGIVTVSFLLIQCMRRQTPAAAVLAGGWILIGFVGGSLLLLYELASDWRLTRAVLPHLPRVFRGSYLLVIDAQGNAQFIAKDLANWSVALVNILAWPMAGLAAVVFEGRLRAAVLAAIATLIVACTWLSVHESSKVAIFVGLAAFAAASGAGSAARTTRALVAVCVLLFALVVPVTYAVTKALPLHEASWAQYSLKERFIIWGRTAEAVAKAPFVGIGARNTVAWGTQTAPQAKPARRGRANALSTAPFNSHAHNAFLQVWFELGVIGAALLCTAFVAGARTVRRLEFEVVPFAAATVACGLTLLAATWNLWANWLVASFGLAAAMLAVADRIVASREPDAGPRFADIWLPVKWTRSARDA